MRAVFGLVSLLVVLAVVGLAVSKQLKSTALSAVPTGVAASAPEGRAAVTALEQSQRIQEQVRSDLTKAVEQGAHKELDQ
jgi:hypothetical protein